MNNKENQNIKDGIKNTFNDVAKSYDNNKQFIISAKKMVNSINIKDENLNILDLSTGTGNIAIELAIKFPNANIFGVDISAQMLNIAKQKIENLGIKNITYQLQDVENLDFTDMKFDIITCGYGLFFYPNMDEVFKDVCSRLKSGGKFIFSTFTDKAFEPYSKIFLDMLDVNYNIKPPKRIEDKPLRTKYEIEKLSSQVKYKNLEILNIEIKYPMNIQQWWELLNTTGYQGLLSQLEDDYSKFEQEYKSHLKLMSQDDNIEFNANSFISIVSM